MEIFLFVILLLLLLIIPLAFVITMGVRRKMNPERIAITSLLFILVPWGAVVFLQFVPIKE